MGAGEHRYVVQRDVDGRVDRDLAEVGVHGLGAELVVIRRHDRHTLPRLPRRVKPIRNLCAPGTVTRAYQTGIAATDPPEGDGRWRMCRCVMCMAWMYSTSRYSAV